MIKAREQHPCDGNGYAGVVSEWIITYAEYAAGLPTVDPVTGVNIGASSTARDEHGNMYEFTGAKWRRKNHNATLIREPFESMEKILERWDITQDPNDLFELAGNVGGSGYLKISKSPYAVDTETRMVSKFTIQPPCRISEGFSIGQKIAGQRFTIGVAAVNDQGDLEAEVPIGTAYPIVSISQTTTIVSITTAADHDLAAGDRVAVYGITSDTRLNYGEMIVSNCLDRKNVQLVYDVNTNAAIPSLTIGQINGQGYIVKVETLWGANNAFALIGDNTAADSLRTASRADKSPALVKTPASFGTHTGSQGAGQYTSGIGADGWTPNVQHEITFGTTITVQSNTMDSTAAAGMVRHSNDVPMNDKQYKLIITARNDIEGMSRPVAKILSATKAGSTTATIVTEQPHGLTVGSYIHVRGIRDQVNFADLTTGTLVASVVNATTFTIAFGASATAASYGGSVVLIQGAHAPAVITQVVQSVARANGVLTVTGTATWTGVASGETVDLYGVRDTAGAIIAGIDGTYKVWGINTTALLLVDTRAAFGTVNCGGSVVKRTDMRLHFIRAASYQRKVVELAQKGINDSQEASPVAITSCSPQIVAIGANAHDSATVANPIIAGAQAASALWAAVSTGDTTKLMASLAGILCIRPYGPPELEWQFACAGAIVNTTDVVLKAAGAAGIRNYITGVQMKNTGTTATEVVIKDGATVIWRGSLPASMSIADVIPLPTPLKGTAATALNFACITTGANVIMSAQGYQSY